MWIKTRKAIPNVGGTGAVRNIDANSARCLIKMRWADPAEDPNKKPPPKPRAAPKPKPEAEAEQPKPAPKRTYQRRDAVPKQKVVLEAEELAEAKAEPKPKEGERDD